MWAEEAASVEALMLLGRQHGSYFHFDNNKTTDKDLFSHRPVILVHGIANNAGSLGRIQHFFLEHGYADEEVYGTTYGDGGTTDMLFNSMNCHYMKVVSGVF